MENKISNIRNVALLGHSGEGKTSLAEAMLYNAKVIDRLGVTDNGNTVMDFDDEEIKRKISINTSIASFEWLGKKINLIDTPGSFDFRDESIWALNVVGACIIVASSNGDISVGTEKAIEMVQDKKLPSMLFLSKVEKDNHSYSDTLAAFKEKYPKLFAVIQIPIIKDNLMTGYIDVIEGKAYNTKWEEIGIPEDLASLYSEYYTELTELAAESDEELLERYFSGEELTQEEVVKGLKKRQVDDGIIFVVGGSCTHNKGVKILMDEIVRCMRTPEETPPRKGVDKDGNTVEYGIDYNEKFSAQVFKTVADAYVGRLSYIKVQTGVLHSGDTVLNTNSGELEKIGGLFKMIGKKQLPVSELITGDIGAISKLTNTSTGDTLCDSRIFVKYNMPDLPEPVLTMSINSEITGEEEKVAQGLSKIREEDKLFKFYTDAETNELLISGMGETHLDVIRNKLLNRYKVKAVLKEATIGYRETVTGTAEARGKHKKQSGGHGQYGDVLIRFEPSEAVFEFAEEVIGGSVPKNYIPAVEKGLEECIKKGVLYGFPMIGLKATLIDGSYHDVDSSEMAFKLAASIAYKEGVAKAKPVVLEPINYIEIRLRASDMGDVLADLSKRRGKVLEMSMDGDYQIIKAEVPQSEIAKYAIDLRSLTRGRGEFKTSFLKYDRLPNEIKLKI